MPTLVLAILASLSSNADEDLKLASALAERGWLDVAGELCDRVEKASGAAALPQVLMVRAEIEIQKARREADPWKAAKKLDEGAALLRDLAAGDIASEAPREARRFLGWILIRKARRFADAVELSESGSQGMFRKAAESLYKEGEEFYKKFDSDLSRLPSSLDLDQIRMTVELEYPRAMMAVAKLAELPADARKARFAEAATLLANYELKFDRYDRWVEALFDEAQCRLEAGETERGETKLREVLRQSKAGISDGNLRSALTTASTAALAKSLAGRGRAKDAIQLLDGALRENQGLAFDLPLRLERAKALDALGDPAGAFSEAEGVILADADGPYGERGKVLLEKFIRKGPSPPEQLLVLADACMDRKKFQEALAHLRASIDSCKTESLRRKYEPVAAFKRGGCLEALGRHLEAMNAYTEVFRNYPSHELAARAGFEAVRCLHREFSLTGDPRTEGEMEKLLEEVTKLSHDEKTKGFLSFLAGEILERKGALREAAEHYRQVAASCEVYDEALIRAAHGWRSDASDRWEKGQRAKSLKAGVAAELGLAEQALKESIGHLEAREDDRSREGLLAVAYRELSAVYFHALVTRPRDGLAILDRWEKRVAPGGESLARIWEQKVQAHLANQDFDLAGAVMEKMLAKFPDGAPTARAGRLAGARFDRRATEMIEKKESAKAVEETLRKAGRYTKRWLDLAPGAGMKLGAEDLLDGSDRLYRVARGVNGLDPQVTSAFELKGKGIPDPGAMRDAATALSLVAGRGGEIPEKDGVLVRMRLARSLGFLATTLNDWTRVDLEYSGLIRGYKLIGPDGRIDKEVARANPWLLGTYLEEAGAFLEMARAGARFNYDHALAVYGHLVEVVAPESEAWWNAKLRSASILFERGAPKDLATAHLLLENLELNHPGFDEGKFGMKEKLIELRDQVLKASGPRR